MKNCTLPQYSLKREESNGVIFAGIGEIFLPILFKVASLDELSTVNLTTLALFIALPYYVRAAGGASGGDQAGESTYFTYLLTK